MKLTLYKAAEELREVLDHMDPESGELPPEYEKASALVEQKAQNVAAYILERKAMVEMRRAHIKQQQAALKSEERQIEWYEGYLAAHMKATGKTSIKSDDGTFSAKLEVGRDESVDVFDAAQLTPAFLRVITTTEPDKQTIKAVLDAGGDVPGARIVARDRLTLR